jgi:methyltransferase-like protein
LENVAVTPRLRDDVCVREIDGEAVILDRQEHAMHSFNLTAACILRAIDGQRTVDEIVEVVRERFEVQRETAVADTARMLEQLEEIGLLQTPAPDGS